MLQATLDLQPALSDVLGRIVAGPVFAATDCPCPKMLNGVLQSATMRTNVRRSG